MPDTKFARRRLDQLSEELETDSDEEVVQTAKRMAKLVETTTEQLLEETDDE